jgi:vacuolar-type H+-ATPase subunit I/STV1
LARYLIRIVWIGVYQGHEFTAAFETLDDSYGFADYDEVNRGAFYAMYPFLFGIMFGDIGHSFLYLLCALGLIAMYPKLSKIPVLHFADGGLRAFQRVCVQRGVWASDKHIRVEVRPK